MEKSKFLTKSELIELSNTEEGKKIVFNYLISARIARAVQEVLQKLEIIPDNDKQFLICNIIYDNLFVIDQEEIFNYIESIKELMTQGDFDHEKFFTDKIGNC